MRAYDGDGNATCRKCAGNMKGYFHEKTYEKGVVCQECGHIEVHGFGIIA